MQIDFGALTQALVSWFWTDINALSNKIVLKQKNCKIGNKITETNIIKTVGKNYQNTLINL